MSFIKLNLIIFLLLVVHHNFYAQNYNSTDVQKMNLNGEVKSINTIRIILIEPYASKELFI